MTYGHLHPLWVISLCASLISCGELYLDGEGNPYDQDEDLPLGQMPDIKADGVWGHATTCKTIPQLEPLPSPRITISLNGLTLHLQDSVTGFDKVYPVGVGEINHERGQTTEGESLSLYPVLATGSNSFKVFPAQIDPCRIWWTDKSTGQRLPVFAGLPFIRFFGPYGIHGPVTGYTSASGGDLKRGYVSHGCVRMEAAHVAELYATIKGVSTVPVRLQKAVERSEAGKAVEVPKKWILSECQGDSDCNYSGGYCKQNPYSGRGFCTASCQKFCDYDKYGYPITFCVNDAGDTSAGYCTYKYSDFNYNCKRFDGFAAHKNQPRYGQPWVRADVCLPGALSGWIGQRCLKDGDCMSGRFCKTLSGKSHGFCTEKCTKYCPDKSGEAGTFCVQGLCRAKCASTSTDCPMGFSCSTQPRTSMPWVKSSVCMPQ